MFGKVLNSLLYNWYILSSVNFVSENYEELKIKALNFLRN